MSILNFDLPREGWRAEIEICHITARFYCDNILMQTAHIQGCEIGKACIKDLHSETKTFNRANHEDINFVLDKFNFTTAVHNRLERDGSFSVSNISVRGVSNAN